MLLFVKAKKIPPPVRARYDSGALIPKVKEPDIPKLSDVEAGEAPSDVKYSANLGTDSISREDEDFDADRAGFLNKYDVRGKSGFAGSMRGFQVAGRRNDFLTGMPISENENHVENPNSLKGLTEDLDALKAGLFKQYNDNRAKGLITGDPTEAVHSYYKDVIIPSKKEHFKNSGVSSVSAPIEVDDKGEVTEWAHFDPATAAVLDKVYTAHNNDFTPIDRVVDYVMSSIKTDFPKMKLHKIRNLVREHIGDILKEKNLPHMFPLVNESDRSIVDLLHHNYFSDFSSAGNKNKKLDDVSFENKILGNKKFSDVYRARDTHLKEMVDPKVYSGMIAKVLNVVNTVRRREGLEDEVFGKGIDSILSNPFAFKIYNHMVEDLLKKPAKAIMVAKHFSKGKKGEERNTKDIEGLKHFWSGEHLPHPVRAASIITGIAGSSKKAEDAANISVLLPKVDKILDAAKQKDTKGVSESINEFAKELKHRFPEIFDKLISVKPGRNKGYDLKVNEFTDRRGTKVQTFNSVEEWADFLESTLKNNIETNLKENGLRLSRIPHNIARAVDRHDKMESRAINVAKPRLDLKTMQNAMLGVNAPVNPKDAGMLGLSRDYKRVKKTFLPIHGMQDASMIIDGLARELLERKKEELAKKYTDVKDAELKKLGVFKEPGDWKDNIDSAVKVSSGYLQKYKDEVRNEITKKHNSLSHMYGAAHGGIFKRYLANTIHFKIDSKGDKHIDADAISPELRSKMVDFVEDLEKERPEEYETINKLNKEDPTEADKLTLEMLLAEGYNDDAKDVMNKELDAAADKQRDYFATFLKDKYDLAYMPKSKPIPKEEPPKKPKEGHIVVPENVFDVYVDSLVDKGFEEAKNSDEYKKFKKTKFEGSEGATYSKALQKELLTFPVGKLHHYLDNIAEEPVSPDEPAEVPHLHDFHKKYPALVEFGRHLLNYVADTQPVGKFREAIQEYIDDPKIRQVYDQYAGDRTDKSGFEYYKDYIGVLQAVDALKGGGVDAKRISRKVFSHYMDSVLKSHIVDRVKDHFAKARVSAGVPESASSVVDEFRDAKQLLLGLKNDPDISTKVVDKYPAPLLGSVIRSIKLNLQKERDRLLAARNVLNSKGGVSSKDLSFEDREELSRLNSRVHKIRASTKKKDEPERDRLMVGGTTQFEPVEEEFTPDQPEYYRNMSIESKTAAVHQIYAKMDAIKSKYIKKDKHIEEEKQHNEQALKDVTNEAMYWNNIRKVINDYHLNRSSSDAVKAAFHAPVVTRPPKRDDSSSLKESGLLPFEDELDRFIPSSDLVDSTINNMVSKFGKKKKSDEEDEVNKGLNKFFNNVINMYALHNGGL